MMSAIQELRAMIELGLPRIQINWGRWPKYWTAVAKMELRYAGYAFVGDERGADVYTKKEPSRSEGQTKIVIPIIA